jgi:hypothetical protein
MIPIGQRFVAACFNDAVRFTIDYRGILTVELLRSRETWTWSILNTEEALDLLNSLSAGSDARTCAIHRTWIDVHNERKATVRVGTYKRVANTRQMVVFLESQRDVFEMNLPEVTTP